MFKNLSTRLREVADRVTGRGRLTEENVSEAVGDVRRALLEADVALPVVRRFVDQVRERAIGTEVSSSLSPGQAFIKIINDELVAALGSESVELNMRAQRPVVILLAGLQGAGKTTSAAKLAKLLKERDRKNVMLTSLDTRRPAAMLQLEQLAGRVEAEYYRAADGTSPQQIATQALDEARRGMTDVLILDSAGRTRLEDQLMDELQEIHKLTSPAETLFVVDSMAGQDAVNAAAAFGEALDLTGVVLTKTDGDARGGAALSVRTVTGQPIKFLGSGEDVSALEVFHPERLASRILGMGDVVGLVEEIQQKVDQEKAEKLARKVQKGKGFDLSDLRDQLQQMLEMGDMAGMLEKLPLGNKVNPEMLAKQVDDKALRRQVAIINSMTPGERRYPKTINGSRKKRIAAGAGLQIQDVNKVLKQHTQMQKMMKRMSGKKMKNMMRGLGGALGGKMGGPGF